MEGPNNFPLSFLFIKESFFEFQYNIAPLSL